MPLLWHKTTGSDWYTFNAASSPFQVRSSGTLFTRHSYRTKAKQKAAELKSQQTNLTGLSRAIQDSLQNGSNPTLWIFKAYLEGPGPHDLAKFAEMIKGFAENTEESIKSFSKLPNAFAVDPSYSQLLAAQNKHLQLFRTMSALHGTATPEDVQKMKEALEKWESANEKLNAAVENLNIYITSLEVLTKASGPQRIFRSCRDVKTVL